MSIRNFTIEEAYEVADAIERNDFGDLARGTPFTFSSSRCSTRRWRRRTVTSISATWSTRSPRNWSAASPCVRRTGRT